MGELGDTFRFVLQNYVDQPDAKKLYEGAMKGMFEALGDPYSVFLDENMLSDMTDITSGQFGGVGLYIDKQAKDPKKADDQPLYIEIVSPIEDTPGAKYGLQSGDLIIKIDGEDTVPPKLLRGPAEDHGARSAAPSSSRIRRGEAEFDATLVRAVVEIPTVKSALIPTPDGQYRLPAHHRVHRRDQGRPSRTRSRPSTRRATAPSSSTSATTAAASSRP